MSHPSDASIRRDFVNAARATAAIAGAFALVAGIAVAASRPPSVVAAEHAVRSAPVVVAPPPSSVPGKAAQEGPASGAPAQSSQPSNDGVTIIEVEMGEFFFTPSAIEVPPGRPVRFVVRNTGVAPHEFLIGDEHAQEDAEKEMAKGTSGGNHSHDGGIPSLLLDPGVSGVIEATFAPGEELVIGCHVPGHWNAGMRGTLRVVA